jgi:hypothetical protein
MFRTPWSRIKTVSGALTLFYGPVSEPMAKATAPAAVIADMQEALTGLIAEFGHPEAQPVRQREARFPR